MPTLDQYPRRDGLYRILPGGVAVHNRYQDKVIMLDSLSSEIWLRADGQTTLREIARDMAGTSGSSVGAMCRTVSILMVIMNSEGVLYPSKHPSELPYHLQLPQEDQDLDLMHNSLIAAGWLDD